MSEVFEVKLLHMERDIGDLKGRTEEADDLLSNHSGRIRDLEHWKDGDGAKGSEERLQCLEEYTRGIEKANLRVRVNNLEGGLDAVQRIADAKLDNIQTSVSGAVLSTLNARDRTTIAKVKAWGPYFATAVVLIGMLLDKFIK